MVEALRLFEVRAHPLGNQIDLEWEAPAVLPSAWEFTLFKKAGTDVTQTDIDNYMDDGTKATGLDVRTIPSDTKDDRFREITDFDVVNETRYYYRMLINDMDDVNEFSASLSGDATPAYSLSPDIVDTKEAVLNVIENILRNYGSPRLKKGVDFDIRKSWGMPQGKDITIYITRPGEQVLQRFLGDISGVDDTDGISFGEIDTDNILVTWSCRNPEHRDILTNIFRETKEAIRIYLEHPDASGFANANIVIQGDSIDRAISDTVQQAGSMLIQITIQVEQKLTEQVAVWFGATGKLKN